MLLWRRRLRPKALSFFYKCAKHNAGNRAFGLNEKSKNKLGLDEALTVLPEPWCSIITPAQPLISYSNDNYLLDDGAGNRAVLRLQRASQSILGIDREQELRFLRWAQGNGFGPQILYASLEQGIVLSRFIDSNLESGAYFSDSKIRQSLARQLARLHDVGRKPPLECSTLEIDLHIEHYWQQFLQKVPTNIVGLERYHSWHQTILGLLADMASLNLPLCLCHNDVNPSNIVHEKGQLIFLDWEYAALGNPLMDLGELARGYRLSDEQLLQFLGDYQAHARWFAEGADTPTLLLSVKQAAAVVCFMSILWYELHGTDKNTIQLAGVELDKWLGSL